MVIYIVILATAAALVLGAIWGAFGPLPRTVQGFVVAMAGGALIVALMNDMVRPALDHAPLWMGALALAGGALAFTGLNHMIRKRGSGGGGKGLLLAVTADGVPENIALGTALIGSDPRAVAALVVAILLSNLPEAAGGARAMIEAGHSRAKVIGIWVLAAALLSAAAILGYTVLSGLGDAPLALIHCIAAGAVVASLAVTVFPEAFRRDHDLSGVAVAFGLILALAFGQLG